MSEPLPREAHAALSEFSRQGLRTLVVAKRQMSAADYAMWRSMWDEAGSEMEDRAGKLDAVAALAEVNLRYLGVTALEDRLQDSVPTTIAAMRKTGLRVWVLTGDKVETAIEIAKSCRLIDANMSLVTLVGAGSPGECMRILREAQATKLKGGAFDCWGLGWRSIEQRMGVAKRRASRGESRRFRVAPLHHPVRRAIAHGPAMHLTARSRGTARGRSVA